MTQTRGAALRITTAPFVHAPMTTRRVMFEVVLSLVPVVAAAAYFFGVVALLSVLAGSAGAMLAERAFSGSRGASTLRDGSALLSGMLLALTLPPALPLWMSFLGGAVAIALGKSVFGGLGQNPFNPALVGRAFLQAAFPTAITTWSAPTQDFFATPARALALPLMKGASVDAVSAATPLGLAKFEGQSTELLALLFGNTAGSLGETSALLLIAVGLWLGVRGVFDWRLPVATLLSVALCSGVLHLLGGYSGPLSMLCSGGLLFAAVFMVTDPVTTPITPRGAWIFGLGVGVLVVLIRLFGGLPEGVMYAVLLMNAVTPLINRYTQPEPFGGVAA